VLVDGTGECVVCFLTKSVSVVFVFLSGSASQLESVVSFWRWKEECVNETESLVESHEFGRSRLTGSGRERVGEVKDRGRRVQPHNSGANCNSACNAAGAALSVSARFSTQQQRGEFLSISAGLRSP
jgi:hypothetical protein